MTTACLVVAGVMHCIVSATPAAKPAEAAAVLAPGQFVYVPTYDGPYAIIMPGSSTAGPYGELRVTPQLRRLDGSPVWSRPQIYGLPIYGRGQGNRRR